MAVIIGLINGTTTATELTVKAKLDEKNDQKGVKISDEDFSKINIVKNDFHGGRNYIICPV